MKRLILILILAGLAFAAYMGAFHSVTIEEHEEGPFTLVYREMADSDMKNAGAITASLGALLADQNVTRRRPLDVFFPDGHSEIGFAVEGILPLLPETKMREVPQQRFLVARFPWRNSWSYLAGSLRVDPALAKHRAMNGYAKTELYALTDGDEIVYMQPIVKKES